MQWVKIREVTLANKCFMQLFVIWISLLNLCQNKYDKLDIISLCFGLKAQYKKGEEKKEIYAHNQPVDWVRLNFQTGPEQHKNPDTL